jgi:outer membrane receptor protein involved in Fe transport
MQATHLPTKVRFLASAAALTLCLSSGMAQVAAPAATPVDTSPASPAPSTSTVTTTTTSTTTASSDNPSESNPTILSPFEVASTEDTGYRAQNTLAGSRINTDLKDLAAPISVVTKDFMNDIGAVDVNDILTYEVGTEGTKDFQSNTQQLGRTSDNAAQDPNGATRGRGLAAFDFTRDYFFSLSDVITGYAANSVGFDSYNLDSVTIVRGADSILAGLGSPAGIINFAPQVAGLEKNLTDVSYRFGSYGDKRATINANMVAKENVFAIRLDAVWNDKGFEQQPASDKDKRYYLTATWKPFKTTTIRASYEDVDVRANYPNTFTPEDDITQWVQLGKPSSAGPGLTAPNLGTALNSGPNVYYNSNGSFDTAYNDSPQATFYQLNLSNVGIWQPLRFSNDQYGNWHDLNTNGTKQVNTLKTEEISIDQALLPNLNLNGAVVHEIGNYSQLNLGRPDFVTDQVDVNKLYPWGGVNPNYGDTFFYYTGLDNQQRTLSTNLVARLALTYDLDLKKYNKWFGRYVATGFLEDRRTTHDFLDYNQQQAAAGAMVGTGPGIITYNGGTMANGYFATTTPKAPFLQVDTPFTDAMGVTTDSFSTIYQLKEEEKDITKLSTSAVVLQAYVLDDLAVGTFGLRRDKDEAGFDGNNGVDAVSGLVNPIPSDQFSAGPLTVIQAQTKTYGVVLHGPKIGAIDLKWLSVGYNQSQNFIPNAGSIDLQGNPTPDPTGTTKDYNISVDLFGGKLNAKIDWFTSIAANAAAPTVNFPLVQWSIPFISLVNNNANGLGAFADLAKQAGITNYTSGLAPGITTGDAQLANAYTANTQSKGMEFELTYNVTRNWRVFGTLTREQAEQSNIAPALTTFINNRVAYWQANGLWNGPLTTKQDWNGQPETGQQVFNDDVLGPFIAYQAASGQPSEQLHKWKASLVTNYTFDQGIAKGFGIGLGLRYLDKTIIGNPAITTLENGSPTVTGLDLANPYTVPGQTTAEGWLTYATKIYNNKYILSFRLEGDNLTSSGGYTPVNANSDGTHQLFTIAPPRTYNFTTELKF